MGHSTHRMGQFSTLRGTRSVVSSVQLQRLSFVRIDMITLRSFGHFRSDYIYLTLNSILFDYMSNVLQRYSVLPAENEGKIER